MFKFFYPATAIIILVLMISVQNSARANNVNDTVFRYPATLVRVIDADTIKVQLTLYPELFLVVNLRINGIDSPESRRGKKNGVAIKECEVSLGKRAKMYAEQLLTKVDKLTVKAISLKNTKYAGRINGQLWLSVNGKEFNYGQYLINQGWAIPYDGGQRHLWPCD